MACECRKYHKIGHDACMRQGVHVCSPCECDCHYKHGGDLHNCKFTDCKEVK